MSSSSSSSLFWKLLRNFGSSKEEPPTASPLPNVSNRTRQGLFSEDEAETEEYATDEYDGIVDENVAEEGLQLYEEDSCYDGSFQKTEQSRVLQGQTQFSLYQFKQGGKASLYSLHPGQRGQCFPQLQELQRTHLFGLISEQLRLVDSYWNSMSSGVSVLLHGCLESASQLQEQETSFHSMVKQITLMTSSGLGNNSSAVHSIESVAHQYPRLDLETACRLGIADLTTSVQENVLMMRDTGLLDSVSQLGSLRKDLLKKEHRYAEQQKQLLDHVLEAREYVSAVWGLFLQESPKAQFADSTALWLQTRPLRVSERALWSVEQDGGGSERGPQQNRFALSLSRFLTVMVTFVSKSKVLLGKFAVAHAKRVETHKKTVSNFIVTVAQACKQVATCCGDILNSIQTIKPRDEQPFFFLRKHMQTQGQATVQQNLSCNAESDTTTMQRFASTVGVPASLSRMHSKHHSGDPGQARTMSGHPVIHRQRSTYTHKPSKKMPMTSVATSSNSKTISASTPTTTTTAFSSVYEYISYSQDQRQEHLQQHLVVSSQVSHNLLQTPLSQLFKLLTNALQNEDSAFSSYHSLSANQPSHSQYSAALTARLSSLRQLLPSYFFPDQVHFLLPLLLTYTSNGTAPVSLHYPCPASIERLQYVLQYLKITGFQGTHQSKMQATWYHAQSFTTGETIEPHTLESQQQALTRMQCSGVRLCLNCVESVNRLREVTDLSMFQDNIQAQQHYLLALLHEHYCSDRSQTVNVMTCSTMHRLKLVYSKVSSDIVPIECELGSFCIQSDTVIHAYKLSLEKTNARIEGLRLCFHNVQMTVLSTELNSVHVSVTQEAWRRLSLASTKRTARLSITNPPPPVVGFHGVTTIGGNATNSPLNATLPIPSNDSFPSNNSNSTAATTVLLPMPKDVPPSTLPVLEMKRNELLQLHSSATNNHAVLSKYVLTCVGEIQTDFVRLVLTCACTGEDLVKCFVSQPRIFQFFLSFWDDFCASHCKDVYARVRVPENCLADVTALVEAYISHVSTVYKASLASISHAISSTPMNSPHDPTVLASVARDQASIVVCVAPASSLQQSSSVPNLPAHTSFYNLPPIAVVESTVQQIPAALEPALDPFLQLQTGHLASQLDSIEETWGLFTQSFSTTSNSSEDPAISHVRSILDAPLQPLPFYLASLAKSALFLHEGSLNITGLTSVTRVFACLTTCGKLFLYQNQASKLPLVFIELVSWKLVRFPNQPLHFSLITRLKKSKSGVLGSFKNTISDTISSLKWRTSEQFTLLCDQQQQADTWIEYLDFFCTIRAPAKTVDPAPPVTNVSVDPCDLTEVLGTLGLTRRGLENFYDTDLNSLQPSSSFYPLYKNQYLQEEPEVLSSDLIASLQEKKQHPPNLVDSNSNTTASDLSEYSMNKESPNTTTVRILQPHIHRLDLLPLPPNDPLPDIPSAAVPDITILPDIPASATIPTTSTVATTPVQRTGAPRRSLTLHDIDHVNLLSSAMSHPFTHHSPESTVSNHATLLVTDESSLSEAAHPQHSPVVTPYFAAYSLVAENPFLSPSLSRADSDAYSSNESHIDPYYVN